AGNVLAAERGHAHVDGDGVDLPVRAPQAAADDAGRRLDREAVARDAPLHGQPAGEDAQPVAALLRLAAVGVQDAEAGVGAVRWYQREHSVAPDAPLAVAQA